ncbi:MAG: nicotinamide-nucleotide amidohydrolase family protein, partial [Paralcaligenes sp.]
MSENDSSALVQTLAQQLRDKGWMMACAESCTGGLLSATLTDLAGSSLWFDRGFVTYSNAAKMEQLRVHADTLERFGAVSEETAMEMAAG